MALTTTARLRPRPATWAGAVFSAAIALALFTRYGVLGSLSRDEAIYAYAGQQLAHGVSPYASIFDPKGPGASLVAGAAAAVARLTGHSELYGIRAVFLLLSVATVVAVYLLAVRVFGSVLAGVVAAVVMSCFRGFAADALAGPDAKVPGILLAVVAMLLLAHRRWTWAAFVGSCAFLVWQPLVFYPAVAVLGAGLARRRDRPVRAVAGAMLAAILPVAATCLYFATQGTLDLMVEAALVFPLTGIRRASRPFGERLSHIATTVDKGYQFSSAVLWIGLAALVLVVVLHLVRGRADWRATLGHPLVAVVAVTGLAQAAYAITDFQGYPDAFPLLPYAALGLGGLAGWAAGLATSYGVRAAVRVAAAALAGLLVVVAWGRFSADAVSGAAFDHRGLVDQQSAACGVQGLLGPHGRVWALGDSAPLVLTQRRNPDRFIYLGSGVDRWKIAHTPGGFDGWTRQIERVHPSVIVMHGWNYPIQRELGAWLRHDAGYHRGYLGKWRVFVDDATRQRARQVGILLTPQRAEVARNADGQRLPPYACAWP